MRLIQKHRWMFLAAACALTALTLSGCTDASLEDATQPVNFGVDINVPYATATPCPDAGATDSPMTITSEGKVTLNDDAFLDAVYDESKELSDDGGSGTYERLELGDAGTAVSDLQTRLSQLNYFSGGISGVYDQETVDAVKLFELTFGTMQTGIASASLQDKLFSTDAPIYGSEAYKAAIASRYTTLQRGDVGSGVRLLQQRLMDLGYPVKEVSGVFDASTGNAVSLFYQSYGFTANEIATVAMQRELHSSAARSMDGGDGEKAQADSGIYTISEGTIGSHVTTLQNRLMTLGYLAGAPSGTCDAATATAISAFQKMLGLAETGEANSELQQVLGSSAAPASREMPFQSSDYSTLQIGSSGSAVSTLQNRLVSLGYASGSSNGRYDATTAAVVNLFRAQCGMSETGIASPELQALLYSPFAQLHGSGEAVGDAVGAVGGSSGTTLMPTRDLNQETSGADVLQLETKLSALGFFGQVPDQTYNDATANAVSDFQRAMGLEQTGVASINLQMHLLSKAAPTKGVRLYDETQGFTELFPGDESTAVLNMQKQLWSLGLLNKEDLNGEYGAYNAVTASAVGAAQLAMGYPVSTKSASAEFQAFLFCEYASKLTAEP